MVTTYRLTMRGARAVTERTGHPELRRLGREAEVAKIVLLERMEREADTTGARQMFREHARAFTAAAALHATWGEHRIGSRVGVA